MSGDRVVITGAGIACSLGNTVSEIWDALCAGRCGIGAVRGFDASGFSCRVAAQVRGLTPQELGIAPRDARIMDTHSYMLMKCADDAYSQALLDRADIPREKIGFFAGMGMVDYAVEDLLPAVLKSLDAQGRLDYDAFYSTGYKEIYPLWPLSMLNNISFCQVATRLNVQGDNSVFSPHGDSAVLALAEGMQSVIEGRSTVVLAGGVSEKITPCSLARAHLSGILSTSETEGACRPFVAERDGTVLGEGCGVVVMEREASARERGAKILGSLTGFGFSFEREGEWTGPTARAIARAMDGALEAANAAPDSVDLIVAHGEGTVTGDRNESEAIDLVFGASADAVRVFAPKAALGHLLAGAALADLVLAARMIETGTVPGNRCAPSPESAVRFRMERNATAASLRRILVNSHSHEGQAASFIVEAVRD